MWGILGSYSSDGGAYRYVDVSREDGLGAVHARRQLGLKESNERCVAVYLPPWELMCNERACMLWDSALTSFCDLPDITDDECQALFNAGLISIQSCACRPEQEMFSRKPEARMIINGDAEEIVMFRRTLALEKKIEELERDRDNLKEEVTQLRQDIEILRGGSVANDSLLREDVDEH